MAAITLYEFIIIEGGLFLYFSIMGANNFKICFSLDLTAHACLFVCFFFYFILVSVLPTASLLTDSKIRAIPSKETLTGLFYSRP